MISDILPDSVEEHERKLDPHTQYLRADGTRNSTGDQVFEKGIQVLGHASFGETATIDTYSFINVKGTMTVDFSFPNGTAALGIDTIIDMQGAIKQAAAFGGKATVTGGAALPFISGMLFQVDQSGTGSWGANPAIWGQEPAVIASRFTSTAGSVTLGNWVNNIVAGTPSFAGGVPTGTYNQFQANPASLASTPNVYGMYIWSMSGSTEGAGIFIKSQQTAAVICNADGIGGRILYGAGRDASHYYDGVDMVYSIETTGGHKFTGDSASISTTAIGFFGNTPVTKPTALTAADNTALDGTIATNDAVTDNLRTRLNELESKLQALGLLS